MMSGGRRPGKTTQFTTILGETRMNKIDNERYSPQLILGPRQSGKTTLALQYLRNLATGQNPYVRGDSCEREIVAFCRDSTSIEVKQKLLGKDIAVKVRWVVYPGIEIPDDLDLTEHPTYCFFFDLIPRDDLIMDIFHKGPEPAYKNPSVVELAIEAPHVKYVI